MSVPIVGRCALLVTDRIEAAGRLVAANRVVCETSYSREV
jgi:hypothetical protein